MTEQLKQCPDCQEWLPLSKFESNGSNGTRKKRCSVCHHAHRVKQEPDYMDRKVTEHRLRQYDLTQEQYTVMYDHQKGVCWICKHVPSSKQLHIDHDHRTGKVRGLLCYRCNVGLGFFKDDIDRLEDAIQYLLNPPFQALLANAPADELN